MSKNYNDIPVKSLLDSQRANAVKGVFAAVFKHEPEFCVRVPGRVNLIGEHIDYCGYGVCPMALKQDVVLAVSTSDEPILELRNDNSMYADYNTSDISNITVEVNGVPEWYQYFLCGVKGVLEVKPSTVPLKGMRVVVSGIVPPSAGLSSSSALVSSAALATSFVHKLDMTKNKLANLCAESEKYIGTQGGGMDQAIAFLATEGCAKLIEFSPLRSKDVALPHGAVFVIAHSLARMNKAATADFNCRVVECRLAAQVIGKMHGLNWKTIRKLGEIQAELSIDLETMVATVKKDLHIKPYSKQEVLDILQTTDSELNEVSLTQNTQHIQCFKLYQRALHVFEESLRVQKFHEECKNSANGSDTTLQSLGRLMFESHESLKDLYEASHPKLDRLVELSRPLAYGARLTGAGWGGCIVALVKPDGVDAYINTLKDKFYGTVEGGQDKECIIFTTSPEAGACLYV